MLHSLEILMYFKGVLSFPKSGKRRCVSYFLTVYKYTYLNSDNQAASKIVNKKICTELLEELFQQLPEQDRFILGHAFGVFGYEKKSLDDIAFEETMKIDGVEKAKKNAIRKLKELYPNSRLKDWKDVYRELMYDCTDE